MTSEQTSGSPTGGTTGSRDEWATGSGPAPERPTADSVRVALRTALLAAMKRRDREAVQTYRVALAAIDNAEAVPLTGQDRAGAIEASAVGLGATEVARRPLSPGDMVDIVRAEAADRREAARQLRTTSPERADALDREADRLEDVVLRP